MHLLLVHHRVVQERSEASLESRQAPPQAELDQEELDFLFDEEMEQMAPRKNKFTDWSDEDDSDYELDDQDVDKILIVTQTPPYLRKHPGGDRTGNHESRAKITSDLAKAINDGLYYYEQDLWKGVEQIECNKVRMRLHNDDIYRFDSLREMWISHFTVNFSHLILPKSL